MMRRLIIASLCLYGTLLASPAGASADAPPLYAPPPTSVSAEADAVDAGKSGDVGVVRTLRIGLSQPGMQAAADAAPTVAQRLTLPLFDGKQIVARRTRLVPQDGYTLWEGVVEGDQHSQVILLLRGNRITGSISYSGGKYRLQFRNGIQLLEKIDPSRYPQGGEPIESPPMDGDSMFSSAADVVAADGETLDVLVVYTPAAQAELGSEQATLDLIDLAIAETNASYANSGIDQRLRLVHAALTSYTEGSFSDDLYGLRDTADGKMDEVHALRDAHGADLVALVRVSSGGSCGLGYVSSHAGTAFTVTSQSCATGYYSFGHELGHNMGATHDRHVSSVGSGEYDYSHGFYNVAGQWRTIMAYNTACSDAGSYCYRRQYWSNPEVNYPVDGVSMGVADEADNRRTLNNTAAYVASFRASVDVAPGELSVTPVDSWVLEGHLAQVTGQTKSYVVSNVGESALDYSVTVTGDWLDSGVAADPDVAADVPDGTLEPDESITITLTVSGSLDEYAPDEYLGNLRISDTTNGSQLDRAVELNLLPNPGVLDVGGSNLTSGGVFGGPFSPASTSYPLMNIGDSSLGFSASSDSNWLSISPTSGTLDPDGEQTVTATINALAEELSVGTHVATVTIADVEDAESSYTRTVTLNVSAPVDATPPVITPTVTGTLGDNGWYTSNVNISWNVVDAESAISDSAGCTASSVTTDTASVTFTCEATSAGGSNSNSVTVKRDATAPVISLISPANASSHVLNSVVNASWSSSDVTSGVASDSGTTNSGAAIDTDSIGGKLYVVDATDSAGNVSQTLHVYDVIAAPDTTAPVITPTVTGTLGDNGWYTSNVSINWNVVDAESAISASSGCTASSVTTDTASVTFTCEATSAGGSNSNSVTVKRDATAPAITITSPANSAEFVLDSVVNADYVTSDALSGLVGETDVPSGSPIDTATLGVKTFTVSATDNAGNSAEVVHSYTVVVAPDTTAPVITPTVTGTLGDNGWYTSNVNISWNVVDAESAISASTGCTASSVTTDTASVTFTCEATSAGGSNSNSVTVNRDATAPVISLTSPVNASSHVLNSVVNASWSSSDATSGVASDSGTTTSGAAIDTASLGSKSYSVSATDSAGNSSDVVHLYDVVVAPDATAPVITPTVTGTLGDNGWYVSNVNVSWDVVDAESAISASSGCDATTVTADTAGITFTCQATSTGGNSSDSVTVKRDTTSPTISLISPAHTAELEQNSLVNADWSVSDALSGIAASNGSTVSGALIDTANLGDQSYSVSATDNAGNTGSVSHSYAVVAAPPPPPPSGQTGVYPLSASSDDTEELINGRSASLTSSDLEMTDNGGKLQIVGLRFANVGIPQGATISRAWIQFSVDEVDGAPALFNIRGQNDDNPAGFSRARNNVADRPLTAESSPWVPDAWENVGDRTAAQQTDDLGAIVQALVNRPGWTDGNAMAFVISGVGKRVAMSFDGAQRGNPADAPALYIEYSAECGPGELDNDNDGMRDSCDPDDDNDGVDDVDDAFPMDASESVDTDGDGIGNNADPDDDNDGVDDIDDDFPLDPTRSNASAQNVEVSLIIDEDDAEETSGVVDVSSGDLEMVEDKGDLQIVGLRFQNVSVPPGVVITGASLQFTADESDSSDADLLIEGEASANPATFSESGSNLSNRPRTAASIGWQPAPWTQGDSGSAQRSASIAAIVQELIGQPGWNAGNAMAFVISGSGKRVAESFDGSQSGAAKLLIEYSSDGTPTAARPQISPDGGNHLNSVTVSLNCATAGSDIHYTLDGSQPSTASPVYAAAFVLTLDTTVKALCVAEGYEDSAVASADFIVTTGPVGSMTFEQRIADGNNDAEETAGKVDLNSGDLELVEDKGDVQIVGLRFPGVSLPQGATITAAWLQFTADETDNGSSNLQIEAEASDNAAAFSRSANNLSARPRSAASASWSPAAWSSVGDAAAAQRSDDLSSVLQEIVDRAGWQSGNALALIVSGNGTRVAESREGGASKAPMLHIEYSDAAASFPGK